MEFNAPAHFCACAMHNGGGRVCMRNGVCAQGRPCTRRHSTGARSPAACVRVRQSRPTWVATARVRVRHSPAATVVRLLVIQL